MFFRSVGFRLIFLSIAWIGVALLAGGKVLGQHFRTHVQNSFDIGLTRHVQEVLSYAEVVDGQLKLIRRPTDPSFTRPLSGWYWEVVQKGKVLERSRSEWDETLALPQRVPAQGEKLGFFIDGPREQRLRVVGKTVSLPGLKDNITVYFTGPAKVIETAMEEFRETLMTSLLVLGGGLAFAVILQVILGLRPLKLLRRRLAAVHAGEVDRLTGRYPTEVEPLVTDLNELLDHNAQVIERARTHAGNLAHALKTPLAVLSNEADLMDGKSGHMLREQVSVMNELVTRHLARARASGGLGAPGLKTDIGDIAAGLKRTLERIYVHRGPEDGEGIKISLVNVRGQFVIGDRQDIEEMLGNLMDNACKWSAGRVRVRVDLVGRDTVIKVDDNGPGVPQDKWADVLERGKRLDEGTPGSGLGLNIVHDLAEMYLGSIALGASDLGGLSVTLTLPAP
ncbi:MAG: HAMP domain-containing histidine kinase [Magnetovibrio sp.]|nr:HAMP domain-containing histidine kinase [Magnetovibrio sp.]